MCLTMAAMRFNRNDKRVAFRIDDACYKTDKVFPSTVLYFKCKYETDNI